MRHASPTITIHFNGKDTVQTTNTQLWKLCWVASKDEVVDFLKSRIVLGA